MARQEGWILLLASKSSARFNLNNPDFLGRKVKERPQGLMHIKRALHGPPDRYSRLWMNDGYHPVVLYVELLLSAGLVVTLHDEEVIASEDLIHIAFHDFIGFENIVFTPNYGLRRKGLLDCE